MRTLIIVTAIIGMLALLTLPALAGSSTSYDSVVVIGKDDPEYDVPAVQNAVNQGGAVLLKGTFDFAEALRVEIKNDIKIYGETDQYNKPVTKIKGGYWTFYSPLPSDYSPPQTPGPKITIRNIHFDGATWTPIHLPYTSGAEISGNKITNVIPFGIPKQWSGGNTLLVHKGIIFGTRWIGNETLLRGAATGLLIFENNEVDLKCDNPEKTYGAGVFLYWTWGATIEIRGNTIENVSRNSVEIIGNYLDEDGVGMITIDKNRIITPTDGCAWPFATVYPNGIVTGWSQDPTAGSDPTKNSKISIINNYVEARGNLSWSIFLLGSNEGIIESNDIILWSRNNGGGIGSSGSYGRIAHNKIRCKMEGPMTSNSTTGISFFIFQNIYGSDNEILRNSILNCGAGVETINQGHNLFYQNEFIDNATQAIDNGQNNIWDHNGKGNFWSDYTGVDANDDGIGDTPYTIMPNGVDNYPLMSPLNPFLYAYNVQLNSNFMRVGMDSLTINARLAIPKDHNCVARAMITSVDSAIVDSVLLCDDGNHADGGAGDGLFGCFIPPQSTENEFIIAIKTVDLDSASDYITENATRFTTIGPVVLDSHRITSSDKFPNPGNTLSFKFTLKNKGLTATAKNVTATLTNLDTCASVISTAASEYRDVAPGETSIGIGIHRIYFSDNCPGNTYARFRLDIASNGYTFWSDTDSVFIYTTSVRDADGKQKIPSEFVLHQNYPNPFNPQTMIEYQLPQTCRMRLVIYNLLGQEIATLLDQVQQTGQFNVVWDGKDSYGRVVPSGVYFYRLETGNFSETKSMILLE